MKDNAIKIGGAIAIVGGSVAMYLAGVGESEVIAIVAGVFVLAGVVINIFK